MTSVAVRPKVVVEVQVMSSYDERPWLARYAAGQPSDIDVEFASALAMFSALVQRDPEAPIIRYFDGVLTRRELDELSGAFAAALAEAGFSAGERVALFLQNVPQFVIAMLATWKAGGIAVPVAGPAAFARSPST